MVSPCGIKEAVYSCLTQQLRQNAGSATHAASCSCLASLFPAQAADTGGIRPAYLSWLCYGLVSFMAALEPAGRMGCGKVTGVQEYLKLSHQKGTSPLNVSGIGGTWWWERAG